MAEPGGRVVWSVGLRSLDCRKRAFESRRVHGCVVVCFAGIGFCYGLITRAKKSYRVCVCVSNCVRCRNLKKWGGLEQIWFVMPPKKESSNSLSAPPTPPTFLPILIFFNFGLLALISKNFSSLPGSHRLILLNSLNQSGHYMYH